MLKKSIVVTLITTMLLTGLVYPFRASGTGLPVVDLSHIATSITGWLGEAGRFALENVARVALENLKRRLLDALVDETIKWVQGGGEPRFVTNTGDFIRSAADAATGDLIQQVGLGDICYTPLRFRLKIQLEQPVFSQRISCTLDDVVENIQAFNDNFLDGGWIAYNEVIKPQNNRWGLEVLAQDELMRKQAEKEEAAKQEIAAGGGFLSQKRCLVWEHRPGGIEGIPPDLYSTPDIDPALYIESPDGFPYTGTTDHPFGSEWWCVQSEIITPGSTIGETVAKAVGSDIDYIMNTNDISVYVSAIADAIINRLTKEAVGGLAGFFTSESSPPRGSTTTTCADIQDLTLRAACEENLGTQSAITEHGLDQAREALDNAGKNLLDANNAIDRAENSNSQLQDLLVNLIDCQGEREAFYENASSTLGKANDRVEVIEGFAVDAEVYETLLAELLTRINTAGSNDIGQIVADTNTLSNNIIKLNIQVEVVRQETRDVQSDVQQSYLLCVGGDEPDEPVEP